MMTEAEQKQLLAMLAKAQGHLDRAQAGLEAIIARPIPSPKPRRKWWRFWG